MKPGALVVALAALAPALAALAFRDGPPARVTGGFGEDSCLACHAGNALNEPGGKLALGGFPERYAPGQVYELELVLTRASMNAAGFELAIRDADNRMQAGTLLARTDDVALLLERGVHFAHHRRADPAQAEAGTARWKLSWAAPESGEVVLHAAAVAADGDDSQLGDHVYTLEARTK